MIIYKKTINEFIDDCNQDRIVAELQRQLKVRRGWVAPKKEKESFNTLKTVSKDLVNLNDKDKQFILLEYVIRDSRKRIDVVLVGKDNNGNRNLAIIELKGWSQLELYGNTKLINAHLTYGVQNHPSYEANDYRFILENMYSQVAEHFNLYSYSYLPNYYPKGNNVLLDRRFEDIISLSAAYCGDTTSDFVQELKEKFQKKVDESDVNLLDDLDYKPTISFNEHMANECESIRLLGSQRVAYESFKRYIELFESKNKKTLFIVSGGAGSGKTIVAIKMMTYLRSLGKNANIILPGPEFRDAIQKINNSLVAQNFIIGANSRRKYDYVIIDEAHKACGNDVAKVFYRRILKNIKTTGILMMDDMQVINKKGVTKAEVKELASKQGYDIVEFDLQEQFRNGGDTSYPNWLKHMIFNEDNGQEEFVTNFFDFDVLEEDVFNRKYKRMYETNNVRMVSFWTQRWDLNNLTPTVKVGNSYYIWNPNWIWLDKYKKNGNKVTKELTKLCKNTNFNSVKKGSQYIAYFNTVQGFEFEYIFVHIPKLFYLNKRGEIDVDISQLAMEEMSSQIWSTKGLKGQEKEDLERLNKLYFLNRLFVNLTRGTKGTYVYIEDEALKDYFKKHYRKVTN